MAEALLAHINYLERRKRVGVSAPMKTCITKEPLEREGEGERGREFAFTYNTFL